MEQEKKTQFRCSGDCLKCSRVQREYCSAQKAYDNQQLLLSIQETVEELKEKVSAIQDNEALVFDPDAQEGDGAENSAPQIVT